MSKSKKVVKNKKVDEAFLLISKELFDKANVDDNITVSTSMSVTVNIGNYESIKYGVSASMVCKHKYAKKVKEELDKYVEEEIKKKYEEYKESAVNDVEVVEDDEDDGTIEIDI